MASPAGAEAVMASPAGAQALMASPAGAGALMASPAPAAPWDRCSTGGQAVSPALLWSAIIKE